jgi:hypothetical protein
MRCVAAGILVRSIEVLANWQELAEDGMLGWRLPLVPRTGGRMSRLERPFCRPSIARCVLVTRLAAAGACLWLPFSAAALPLALGLLLASQAYYSRYWKPIATMADTMFVCGLAALFAASLDATSAPLREIALWFVGLQVLLAYFAAGLSKVRAAAWRNGTQLVHIFTASDFRSPLLRGVLTQHPALPVTASWLVIGLQLLLPFSILLPTPVFYLFLAAGLAFHATIAVVMGLHSFFWGFGAGYPGVYFIHRWLH